MLIENGCNVNVKNLCGFTPLNNSAYHNNSLVSRLLIEGGCDVDTRDFFGCCTPLLRSVDDKNIDLIRLLLERGCDVNAVDLAGWSALHLACYMNNVEISRLLIEKGCDITLRNRDNKTPFELAAGNRIALMYEKHQTWCRRREFALLLAENGYVNVSASNSSPPLPIPKKYENLLSNEEILSIFTSYL